jgi:hypothetical protein
MPRIPKVLHYTYGFSKVPERPWSLVNYVCLRSAVERLRPERVFFYYEFEPTGAWWALSRDFVTLVQVRTPREIFGNPLTHVAHCTDVIRLQKLSECGGIYLDPDVLVHRSFDDLLDHSTVLGREGEAVPGGTGNAVILAEQNGPFIQKWLASYRSFRSRGRDEYWNEHSILVPANLARAYPSEVTILPHTAFHWPLFTREHLDWIYDSSKPIPLDSTYANHLWETSAAEFLLHLTPGKIRSKDSNFHLWARPFVEGLPDDYGAPSVKERVVHQKQKSRQRGHRMIMLTKNHTRSVVRKLAKVVLSDDFLRRRSFQNVYKHEWWGREDTSKFYSGVGSRGPAAAFYVERMAELLKKHAEELGRPLTIVDIGCGDFHVACNLLEKVPDCNYIGCDIVPEVIAHNAATYANNRVRFQTLDAVRDSFPEGDVCLIRQVLQHLPNADILKIVHRLPYAIVYVTEGQPVERAGPVNPDKPVGAEVRFNWRTGRGRGVELAQPPFNLDVTEVFRTPSHPGEIVVTDRVRLLKA